MILKGSVEEIIFSNEDNGYTVMNFNAGGNLIVAVGIFPVLSEGEALELTGEYKYNVKFGEQFVVSNVEFLKPNDIESIKKYLSSGLFRGVGEVTAEAIVEKFGIYTLEIIEKTPGKLMTVNKIGRKKAEEISKCYIENNKVKDAILFLQKCDITTGLALKIYKVYEAGTVDVIKNNPYRMVQEIDGVGFLTADRIAGKLGIARDSIFRITAGVICTLQEASQKNGHTCLPENNLIKETSKLIGIEEETLIKKAIEEAGDILKFFIIEGERLVCLALNYYTENSIAAKLVSLNNSQEKLDINIEAEIDVYEKQNAIILDKNQREAVTSAINNGVVIITGGPGTGKTTIIKCITTILGQRGLKVALCAPTGRASKRMSEATGEDARTLHRLLGITGKNFEMNELHPLEIDAIIVDEISMADIYIFNALLKAIPSGVRLILVGDKDQLPSVSCGNILADMIASGLFCTVYLTQIYRQAKESMIIVNAHRINNSEMPIARNDGDFFIDNKFDSQDIKSSVISMVSKRIPEFLSIASGDIQVLSPMKKGLIGVESLNAELQRILNPIGKEIKYGNTIFRVGDKVMHILNNYTIKWTKTDGFEEKGSGIFNGDIGYIAEIKGNDVLVEYEDGKLVSYNGGNLDELMLAYCISVHKAQGSEFPVVIIVISSGSYAILTKNLLYTAVTRAKKMVVIVGAQENIEKMVKNNYTAKRYSILKDFLIQNDNKYKKLWGNK